MIALEINACDKERFDEMMRQLVDAENALDRARYHAGQVWDAETNAPPPPPVINPPPSPAPTPAPSPSPATAPTSFRWQRGGVGGGGFITAINIAPDGSRMVIDTDVWNGSTRRPGDDSWTMTLRLDNVDRAKFDPRPDNGKVMPACAAGGKRADINMPRSLQHSKKGRPYEGFNLEAQSAGGFR